MRLSQLLAALSGARLIGGQDPEITHLEYDSRRVQAGSLFVAIPGFRHDGHAFISDAVARGAAAVVGRDGYVSGADGFPVPLILISDCRRALAELAAAFYGHPARHLKVIGVTGTNGKTTTCYLIEAILRAAGHRTGLVGTVTRRIGQHVEDNLSHGTTPEAPELQELLAQMVAQRVEYVVLETTSHALVLDRVWGCEFDLGVFTNLSPDHLDLHGTMEQYLHDKGRLFAALATSADKGLPKLGVLNADDSSFDYLASVAPRWVSYGLKEPTQFGARDVTMTPQGSRLIALTPKGEVEIRLRLPGQFNIYNCLAAVATTSSLGIALETIAAGLESVAGVPGRMEAVDGGPFSVIVDYAHTPDSLEKVLRMLRPLLPKGKERGRLMAVFGCTGDRDRTKRPKMGAIAAELCDFFVLTDDDPHFEDRNAILDEIEAGIGPTGRKPDRDYFRIPDRREAIRAAFERAQSGDIVLLAGKGHEQYIIYGDERRPWDDRQVAHEELAALHKADLMKSQSP